MVAKTKLTGNILLWGPQCSLNEITAEWWSAWRGSGDKQHFMGRSVCPHPGAHNVSPDSNVQLHLPARDKRQRLAEARQSRSNGQQGWAVGLSFITLTTALQGLPQAAWGTGQQRLK